MKAMILAAGLGSRLRPYTGMIPKALVPVAGIPMLEYVVHRLKSFGVNEIIINVHHFAEQVIAYVCQKNNFNIHIEISHEKDLLLDSGGGLKKAAWFFDDGQPFILHNVDVLSNINLTRLCELQASTHVLAALAVSERKSLRYLLFDKEMRLCGWEHTGRNERIMAHDPGYQPVRFAFSGIHLIDPAIFGLMTEEGRFSLVDVYLRLAGQHPISGMPHPAGDWVDMGRPADLEMAAALIRDGKFGFMP